MLALCVFLFSLFCFISRLFLILKLLYSFSVAGVTSNLGALASTYMQSVQTQQLFAQQQQLQQQQMAGLVAQQTVAEAMALQAQQRYAFLATQVDALKPDCAPAVRAALEKKRDEALAAL